MATKTIKRKNSTKGQYMPPRGLAAKVALVDAAATRTDFPDYRPGDTVKVHTRIKEGEKERIQIFEGTVIACSNRGVGRSFTVRKVSHGVGVERIFLESSKKVAKLEVSQHGRVRRSKLYYLREREGKAARVERAVTTNASLAQSQAAAKKSET